jgi:spore coat polysaccharide biosynthesis protein SpsF (cytidylyltransferase family)/aryl-alcohol dehydrogenase-like predicted oxidoreductase
VSSIIVIQARTGSSRLPAKVLLPVAGIPLVVLAAKRAANNSKNVLVATSVEDEDDVLCETLKSYGIQFYRGSLQNTLERMVNAVESYDDETIFIRLTADNVFPDGQLIDEIENDFHARSLEYLCCNGAPSGLPYGMSVEVTRLKHLREAATSTPSQQDQEHVTPYIIRKFGATYFEKYKSLGKGHYRCTVDLYDDYINISRAFAGDFDPIAISGISLISRLETSNYKPLGDKSIPQLVIGTAQFGLEYGIANSSGQPNITQVEFMLKTAINNGVEYIDTARAYGDSEKVIGKCLGHVWSERIKIITKLTTLNEYPEDTQPSCIRARVDASVFESCARLCRQSIDVAMIHRAAHFNKWNGAVWNRLIELQDEGVIKSLGVSIQTPEELKLALDIESVSFIQMPFNILDWRWGEELQEKIKSVKKLRQLTIHVRSALLQGLLVNTNKTLWERAHISDSSMILDWFQRQIKINGCTDVVDLCQRYVCSQPWVDGVVLGMETREQLEKNIQIFNLPYLHTNQLLDIELDRPWVSEKTLDPSFWLGA